MELTIDPKYTKTYESKANLDRALARLQVTHIRHIIAWTECGRVTAVFIPNTDDSRTVAIALTHQGFKAIG